MLLALSFLFTMFWLWGLCLTGAALSLREHWLLLFVPASVALGYGSAWLLL